MQVNKRIEGGLMLRKLAIDPIWGMSQYAAFLDASMSSDSIAVEMYRESRQAAQITLHGGGGKSGSIAQLEFKGVMLTEGDICTGGIDMLCGQIAKATNDSSIRAIMLNTHSGGGEVFAAQRLGNAIQQARQQKPVVMFVDGICASGAYWAAAHCDEIIAGGRVTEFGSIGVVIQMSKSWIEMMREEYEGIYANGSERKHEFLKDLLAGNYGEIAKRELDPIRAEFVKVVKSGRGKMDEEVFTGAMFNAPQAKKLGMIDHIGTRDLAISRAAILANKRDRQRGAKIALEHARN